MLKDPILQTKIKTYRAKENRKNEKQNQRFCDVQNLIYIPNKSNSKQIEIQKEETFNK
jgi:hypothetical protein